jgi:hypothetical protein
MRDQPSPFEEIARQRAALIIDLQFANARLRASGRDALLLIEALVRENERLRAELRRKEIAPRRVRLRD